MNMNPVGWFEIYVRDLERAKKFYETVFETKLQQLRAPFPGIELWAFSMEQNSYGAPGALVRMEGVEPGGTGTIVYFHCLDCAVEENRVAGRRSRRSLEDVHRRIRLYLDGRRHGRKFDRSAFQAVRAAFGKNPHRPAVMLQVPIEIDSLGRDDHFFVIDSSQFNLTLRKRRPKPCPHLCAFTA